MKLLPLPRLSFVCLAVVAVALVNPASAQSNAASTASATTPASTDTATPPTVTGAATSDKDVSKEKHYVITDYGAVADGKTLNTAFIQKAIDTAAAAGGAPA